MVPDAEVLCILCEALTALDIGDFTVKVRNALQIASETLKTEVAS
jgi:histidyl-tRNA synthetase